MTPTEVTEAFYELFGAGKIDELQQRFIGADSVLDNPLPAPIPFGGRYVGAPGFLQYAQEIFAGIQIELFEIDEIIVHEDRVVVLGREISRSLKTGKRYSMSWVHVLTVRDGHIVLLREYNDTAAMAAAFA